MNSINEFHNNNLNFTAKMNILTNEVNTERLQKIAQKFEAKTAKYPNDTFEINGTKKHGFQIYHFDNDLDEENCCDITNNQWNNLFKNSNDFIADKFIKLFEIFKHKNTEYNNAKKYINSVRKNDQYNDPTDFEQKFWDIFTAKTMKERELTIAKDSTLKNFEIY